MRSLETKLNSLLGNELSEPLTTAVHASPKRPSAFGLFGVLWGFRHDRQARADESLPGGLNVAIGLTDSALIVVDRSYWNTKVASVAAIVPFQEILGFRPPKRKHHPATVVLMDGREWSYLMYGPRSEIHFRTG